MASLGLVSTTVGCSLLDVGDLTNGGYTSAAGQAGDGAAAGQRNHGTGGKGSGGAGNVGGGGGELTNTAGSAASEGQAGAPETSGGSAGSGSTPGSGTGGAAATGGASNTGGSSALGGTGGSGTGLDNLFPNGDFEAGTVSGWATWGTGAFSATSTLVHGGTYALLHSGRTGDSPATYKVTALLQAGQIYDVSIWIAIGGAATATAHLTAKIQCDDASASYVWLNDPITVQEGVWTRLAGKIDLSVCTELVEVIVYEEGPGSNIDVFLDDAFLGLSNPNGTGGTSGTGGSSDTGGVAGSSGGASGAGGSGGDGDTGGTAGLAGQAGAEALAGATSVSGTAGSFGA